MRRQTKQREAVLKAIAGSSSHPTADMIYDEVRKAIPEISKGTVYRNLRVLQEMGQVLELTLDGHVSRYEAKQDSHYHFRCESCGRVSDLDIPVDEDMNRRVSAITGLKVARHQLEFCGICDECQTASKKNKGG